METAGAELGWRQMQETGTKATIKKSASLLEDSELIDRLAQRETAAQEEFVRRFEKLIRVVLAKMELTRQDQEDLYQQVFLHLWEEDFRRLRLWDATKGRLCSYLGVVAAHLSCDYKRRKAASVQTTDIDQQFDLPAQNSDLTALTIQRAQAEAIRRTLRELKPRDSSLLRQRHFDGLSYREIAEASGMTINYIGVALARAESRLRKKLHESHPGLFDFGPDTGLKPRPGAAKPVRVEIRSPQ